MNLFERFEELSRIIDSMNAQAADTRDIPVILLHDYVHYCDVQTFLKACTHSLRLSPAQTDSLMAFFYRDTLERKSELGALDLYTFTRQFFKYMTYRIGNLDTPDDLCGKAGYGYPFALSLGAGKTVARRSADPAGTRAAGQNGSKRAGTLP